MVRYTKEQYGTMVRLYYLNDRKNNRAAAAWRELYGDINAPDGRTIYNAVVRMERTGNACPAREGFGAHRVLDVETEEAILAHFEENPTTSVRAAAQVFGLSKTTVHRLLEKERLHPFKVREVQTLELRDPPRRLRFCEYYLARVAEDPVNFQTRILWSDESHFTREGMFNSHNFHIWAEQNPHAIRQGHNQRQFSINVWAGIINNELIGPIFPPDILTGATYLELLQNDLPAMLNPPYQDLDEMPLMRRNIIFQQDGAPPHYTLAVREFLDQNYPERWIGRGGPIQWPPRSPDLTPLDFYLWGTLKSYVYQVEIRSREHLMDRIVEAFSLVNADHIRRATQSVARRAQMCIEQGGGHFEQLL